MSAKSIDLVLTFGKNSTAKDAQSAYRAILKYLLAVPNGVHTPLHISTYNAKTRSIRITADSGVASTGVVGTPHTPPPHPPIYPPDAFTIKAATPLSSAFGNFKNISSGKVVSSLTALRTALTNVASGKEA